MDRISKKTTIVLQDRKTALAIFAYFKELGIDLGSDLPMREWLPYYCIQPKTGRRGFVWQFKKYKHVNIVNGTKFLINRGVLKRKPKTLRPPAPVRPLGISDFTVILCDDAVSCAEVLSVLDASGRSWSWGSPYSSINPVEIVGESVCIDPYLGKWGLVSDYSGAEFEKITASQFLDLTSQWKEV